MNADYVRSYTNLNGEKVERKSYRKMFVKIFAGFKFLFDRIVSFLGLLIVAPIMLVVAIAIKLDSKGPILFKQIRTGKKGKNITIYKFRTMVANNDVHDFSKEDQHTKLGTFLRKTSLDELPQLFNIVKGDLSFIGPRPWIPDYFDNMNENQRVRYCVRPGLTGLAQVNGRNAITIFDKIKYDLEYIKNYSLRQDFKIVFLTIKAVLTGQGADSGKGGIKNDISNLKKYNKNELKQK